MSGKRLGLDLRLQKRFGSGLLTFNHSKCSFNFFSELLTRFTNNTLYPFFHTAIRPDGETNDLLGHRRSMISGAI